MRLFMALLLTLALALPAFAAFEGPNSAPQVTTVAQALQASDDTPCVLEGNIVEKITGSSDKYVFKDSTGSMTVEIDHKVFMDRRVTPQNKVRLSGKVDTEMMRKNEMDVKVLDLI